MKTQRSNPYQGWGGLEGRRHFYIVQTISQGNPQTGLYLPSPSPVIPLRPARVYHEHGVGDVVLPPDGRSPVRRHNTRPPQPLDTP